ncbi:MAG TPA: hypothetical protein VF768_05350, partial [Holophagaceae bacterium]
MNSQDAEHILAPIWQGFEAALARTEALLAESQAQPTDRGCAAQRLQHEAELMQAREYLQARRAAFIGTGLMVALDTGRAIRTWPNAYPASDAASRVVEAWRNKGRGKVERLK